MVVDPKSTAMHLTRPQLLLWLTPTVVESVIVMTMICRKLWRNLPIFFSYLIFEIARTCFLFLQRNNAVKYFYAYWVTEALGCFAAICVIKELFDNAFRGHRGLRKLGSVLFQWSVAVLLAVSALIAWTSSGPNAKRVMAGILIVKQAVTLVESGLLGFLFLFAFALGLRWQHYATGVCLGFGIYGSVELFGITARTIYGPAVTPVFNWVMMVVNTCCVLIWAAYFVLPQSEQTVQSPIDVKNRLEEWNQAILELTKR